MFKSLPGRLTIGASVIALLSIAAAATTLATRGAIAGGGDADGDAKAAPGTLDDGKELLPLAKVSLADAITAAKRAASGDIGEVDLEYWKTGLVFNIDIGAKDVKVDATSGEVVGVAADDE